MLEPIPTISNGGRNPNGTLAPATRPITAPTKKISYISIDESKVKRPRKPWPHWPLVTVLLLVVPAAVGFAFGSQVVGPWLMSVNVNNVGVGTPLFIVAVAALTAVGLCVGWFVSTALKNLNPYVVKTDDATD
jgi:hypothetical protein